ncbi:MAG: ABC transporter ATP-binding protein [Bacillota bacterium]
MSINVVEIRDLDYAVNGNQILEKINLQIEAGEFVGIIGPNGAGKTTLLRLLLGLIRQTSGQVRIFGLPPAQLGKKREAIGYMPQRPTFDRRFPLSTLDVVNMGLVTAGSLGCPLTRKQREKARCSLEQVGLAALQNRPFSRLSGGEQQRAFLARAICREPLLLLLDEPNTGLDLPTQHNFFNLLQQLQHKYNLTVVMVSHDLVAIARFAHRLVCINRTMHVHGKPLDVLNSPHLEKAYRCEFDVLFGRERG